MPSGVARGDYGFNAQNILPEESASVLETSIPNVKDYEAGSSGSVDSKKSVLRVI